MSKYRFEIYQSRWNRRWYWRLKCRANGEIVARSAGGKRNGYASKELCKDGIGLIRSYAIDADVVEVNK